MPKYIKLHLNKEVIYLNPEFIVGFGPYNEETILYLSHPFHSNNNNILTVDEDMHTICRLLDVEE